MPGPLEGALAYALEITRNNLATLQSFPERCEGERWQCVDPLGLARTHWVDGFWTGLLWLAYAVTGDDELRRAAAEWTGRVAWLRFNTGTHDLGFVFLLSHVLGARLSSDPALATRAMQAADTLSRRYNPVGEYFQAWGTLDGHSADRGLTNIELMMNIALLFWSSVQPGGDPRFARWAARHARTSRLVLVRPDGSTIQVAEFEPTTGAFECEATFQGYSPTSCWSRGQAIGLYGFATAFRYTGDPVFLGVGRRLARYALEHAPFDRVPYWDYASPEVPNTYRDSSAAAILAAGLLELAAAEPEALQAQNWREAAEAIVLSLWEHYSTRGTRVPALLLQGARSVPQGLVGHALIYGDYYFMEALVRLLNPDLANQLFPEVRKSAAA